MTPREAERLIKAQADYIEYQRRVIEDLQRRVKNELHPFLGISRGGKYNDVS
jgi:hypothetical protein